MGLGEERGETKKESQEKERVIFRCSSSLFSFFRSLSLFFIFLFCTALN